MIGTDDRLRIELGGQVIGHLIWDQDEVSLHYSSEWQQKGFAISPYLPLDNQAPASATRIFLRNLLPEGEGLDTLLETYRLSRTNTYALIRALGADTPGALVFTPEGQPRQSEQEPIFRQILEQELVDRLDQHSFREVVIWDDRPRLSVAGVQLKINVLFKDQDKMGFGEGSLCSTHLLKFERDPDQHLVINELLVMKLAAAIGLPVARVELRRFGPHRALLVERFDRRRKAETVYRRHLIDGCQALNLPPEYKYERNLGSGRDVAHIREGVSLPSLFAFCDRCRIPAVARKRLLEWVLFNLIVCNWDAHGKNISFFVDRGGIEVAPAYDLVDIDLYPGYSQELAMALGDEFDSGYLTAYQLADFADSCSLSRSLVASMLKRLCSRVLTTSILPAAVRLQDEAEHAFAHRLENSVTAQTKRLLEECRFISGIEL